MNPGKNSLTALVLFLALSFSKSYGQVDLTNGLVAYYPFSGNANDASGYGNHAVFNNATLTADRAGNPNGAYKFNGVDNYMRIPNSPSLNPSRISMVAFVKVTGFYRGPCHGNVIINKGDDDFNIPSKYRMRFDDYLGTNGQNCNNSIVDSNRQAFYADFGGNGAASLPYNGPFIEKDRWYCVIYTFDGSTVRFYIDGVLIRSRATSSTYVPATTDLFFGKMNNSLFPYWFNGVIDEIRIYNRALNQDEVNALCGSLPCGNWLGLPSNASYMEAGDLDVPGTSITVEALINRTAPYSGGPLWAGDVVSKHDDPFDCNYLLRPNSAEITTSDGYFVTPTICDIQLNKTYHIAMVYDGSTLKFYRNGFLMSQVAATGTLFQNDWPLRIGLYATQFHNTQFIGYVNEVRIWNVARTQNEIRTYMNASLPSPATQTGLLAYYIFDNLKNKQGNTAWNGTLGGNAAINQSNPTCTAYTPDTCAVKPSFDFTYKQNICNPYSIQFNAAGNSTDLQAGYWSFGDGNTLNSGDIHPVHTYSAFNNYVVKFSATNGILRDTVTKTISVNVVNDNALIVTPDTVMCEGASKQLRTQPGALDFCWSPTTYLDDPVSPSPVASPPHDITYYFNAEVTGPSLVVNGDFSAGNSGFTSQYNYSPPPNLLEGEYYIGTNPQTWNGGMSNCRDHTTGNGNMLMVNGSATANVSVWKQTINVTPHTNYAFSTWIQALHVQNPAQLQFSINGRNVGTIINASLPPCTWTQFYTTWNSGDSTTAVISVVNQNTQLAGNDFALDDISFAPVFIKRDSVRITVERPVVDAVDVQPICEGNSVQLNATGMVSYSWLPATNLSDASIANPVANPAVTTKYIVTGVSANGCTAKDSVIVTVNVKPQITATADTSICRDSQLQLFASGGVAYAWTPSATLDDTTIANPVASPAGPTKYFVKVTDANNCENIDSVQLDILPDAVFGVTGNKPICKGEDLSLVASGGDVYSWSPVSGLSAPNASTTTASPSATTSYTVHITETTCNTDSVIAVNVVVSDVPSVTVQKSNDIDCASTTANLITTGNATAYVWSPVTGLDDPRKSNPVTFVNVTTTYTVTGTNQFGCSASDTVTVKVTNAGKPVFELPNAFTPNGDRVNDCFGIRRWAQVNQLEFLIYNRWGQVVFATSDPSKCWDGTLKGKPQDSGGFVYVIKAKSLCGEVLKKGTVMLIR